MKQYINFEMEVPGVGFELEVKGVYFVSEDTLVVYHELKAPDGYSASLCWVSDHVLIDNYFKNTISNVKHYVTGLEKDSPYKNPESFTIINNVDEIKEMDPRKTTRAVPFKPCSKEEAEKEKLSDIKTLVKTWGFFAIGLGIGVGTRMLYNYIQRESNSGPSP